VDSRIVQAGHGRRRSRALRRHGRLHRQDNVIPKARTLFQIFYGGGVTQGDIFHYVYAVLHHPAYRARFAENLKCDLPRIPFIGCRGGLVTAAISGKKSVGGARQSAATASFFALSAIEGMLMTMEGAACLGAESGVFANRTHLWASPPHPR